MTDKEYMQHWRRNNKARYNDYVRNYRATHNKRSVSSLVTEEDYQQFKKLAESQDMTPSALIRELIKEAIAHV